MAEIQPVGFDIHHYAKMTETIDYQWWINSGLIRCVAPKLLAISIGQVGWEFHHIHPLLDTAKSIEANPDPVPLKRGNHRWNRVIVVDGITVYMGVLLFNLICEKYHLEPRKEKITEQQFVETFKKFYPEVMLNHLDDDYDDVWVAAKGYWDASRILYNRPNQDIRMWRNYGRYDYHFKSLAEFEKWLENAKSYEREFETIHEDYL